MKTDKSVVFNRNHNKKGSLRDGEGKGFACVFHVDIFVLHSIRKLPIEPVEKVLQVQGLPLLLQCTSQDLRPTSNSRNSKCCQTEIPIKPLWDKLFDQLQMAETRGPVRLIKFVSFVCFDSLFD